MCLCVNLENFFPDVKLCISFMILDGQCISKSAETFNVYFDKGYFYPNNKDHEISIWELMAEIDKIKNLGPKNGNISLKK